MYSGEPRWNTPIIRLDKISRQYKANIYAKLETGNPTCSHKDRESAMIIVDMRKKGFKKVACASTGNAAISLAAFAWANGFAADIFVCKKIREEKLKLLRMFAPTIHMVDGDFEDAVNALLDFLDKEKSVYNANAGYCEAKLIGNSYIGMELAEQLKPDYVICPTNNGTLLVGVWLGLKKKGVRAKMVAAVASNTQIADSIAGFHKLEGDKITQTIQESGGCIIEVSDEEIARATIALAKEGVICEPASAASLAAVEHLEIGENASVCCIITGSGMKYPELMSKVLHT